MMKLAISNQGHCANRMSVQFFFFFVGGGGGGRVGGVGEVGMGPLVCAKCIFSGSNHIFLFKNGEVNQTVAQTF